MSSTAARTYDLVLFGATGFVGRLTAEYLAGAAPAGTRIALAGRSEERLRAVRDALPPAAADWALLTADAADPAALAALAASTTAVATTVGPYALYGLPLVEACAAAGTHYADLTGEVLFMDASIRAADEAAKASGARIVHTCGFDSIPSDLGVLLLHRAAQERGAGELREVDYLVSLAGGLSGGTLASMREQVAALRSTPSARRIVGDPYALSPDRAAEPDLGKQPDLPRPSRDPHSGKFRAPFVMGAVNSRVVRRSNALQGHAYGRELRYREWMATGRGLGGAITAFGINAGLPLLVAGFWFGPSRRLLSRVMPSPGEGPSEQARRDGYFRVQLTALTSSGQQLAAEISAQGDPGYQETATMLGEAALALALDGEQLPKAAGVLTPATAIGDRLIDRLRAAGHRYEIVS